MKFEIFLKAVWSITAEVNELKSRGEPSLSFLWASSMPADKSAKNIALETKTIEVLREQNAEFNTLMLTKKWLFNKIERWLSH